MKSLDLAPRKIARFALSIGLAMACSPSPSNAALPGCKALTATAVSWQKSIVARYHSYIGDSQAHRAEIAKLLNEAMLPLITEYQRSADGLSNLDIEERAKAIRYSTPPKLSRFVELMDPKISEWTTQIIAEEARNSLYEKYSRDVLSHARYGASRILRQYQHPIDMREFLPFTENTAEYYWLEANPQQGRVLGFTNQIMPMVITAVGEYGPRFERHRQITARLMMDLATETLMPIASSIYESNSKLLIANTARAEKAGREHAVPRFTPVSAMNEGILSLHQLISLMLAKKIAGIDSPLDALRAIVNSKDKKVGLVSEFTARLPMGFVGPAALSGLHFTEPLVELRPDGQLRLTAFTRDFTSKANAANFFRKKGVCPFAAIFKNSDSSTLPKSESAPCQTGIQEIAEIYLRIFEQVNRLNL